LPTDRPRPAVQDHAGATYDFTIGKDVAEGLRRLSQCESATLFMTLLAAFQLLLSRYSGQSDICVGTAIANRRRPELESLIGFFVNMLVLRVDLTGNPSFAGLLARVREAALGAQAHQDLPFERLVDELQPQRDMSITPLFQAGFDFQAAETRQVIEKAGAPRLRVEALKTASASSKFDLSLILAEEGRALSGSIEYATALFDAGTIARFARHFGRLLEGIAADPSVSIHELPLLDEHEAQRLLVEWNATAVPFDRDAGLYNLFEVQAARRPDAIAALCGEARLTYGELDTRANRLARV